MNNDLHSLSEEDIKLRYITPAILQKGWSVTDITMETKVKLTDGKINLRGNLVARGKAKFADYMLYYNRATPIAIVEAKDANHSVSHGMQQAKEYAAMMDVPFAFSSNGLGFQEYDFLAGKERTLTMDEIVDTESGDEKSRCFTAQQLMDLGLNFDQCKFPKEEEEVLRPEELLKQYHEKRTALDAKIDQTLSEIQKILGVDI